jgi:hypothetical protein
MIEVAEDLEGMCQYGFGKLFEGLDGGGVGFEDPLLQILLRRFLAWLVP